MATTDHEATYGVATATRRLAAEMFAGLSDEQWRTPSLCGGWTVREVAAHLAEPLETGMSTVGLLVGIVRARGSLDRMVDTSARRYAAARTPAQLVRTLRERADERLDPPVIGPHGPMSDSLIHLRDAARPLGAGANPPPEHWRHVLDFLTDPQAVTKGFSTPAARKGLRLVATDQDWTHGDGAELTGPSEALTMALTGRAVALDDLSGAGVDVLRSRLA
ncbi:maleylpyruvate isomerase family mycothiol-dependent enzyme [Nocardioides sp. CFH 31398]|uniref:maleylpyruvate isomerase family mycothiol-dependent enzyme n=1 Tax=Nocardioides sp. CFH 31398 TaxID=2919579 RepID=UPI001F06B243|nr:maleylpyruvate isomerase family mycothiol-dependent enzyme [Nocardioides sp. CFH 31398]MCH1868076.1 maleylpyruvate isomerase family mycothiol-dependent enzyme [Nocardioides sp. CFH 31398]